MKRLTVAALMMVLAGIFGASGQQRTVIAGLETHAGYRTLVDEEGALVRTADSLTTEIASLRRRLRADTLGRAATSEAIVRLEERGLEIRRRMASLASKINNIEQEWVLANLSSPATVVSEEERGEETGAGSSDPPNLVYGSWFEQGLTPDQLAELHRAQEAESEIPLLVEEYRRGQERAQALALEYGLARSQGEADSIRAGFDFLSTGLHAISRRIAGEWEAVFDSKSYLYNLLADKENRSRLLALFEEGMERLREEQSRMKGAPAPLVDYVLQKRMLTDYETALAEELGNTAAADSLRRAATALSRPESLTEMEPVVLRERLFLDYSDVEIGGTPYNANNPIPEVAVWPRGIIWRIQVGNFTSRQPVSNFRGAHPLAFSRDDDGRYRYFAGGFPTDSLAGAALELLRTAGFRAPSTVVWMDGVRVDSAAEGEDKIYRVEISGVEELPAAARTIAAAENGADIVRAAGTATGAFIVAPLNAAAAIRLRSALEELKDTYPGLEAKLLKIAE